MRGKKVKILAVSDVVDYRLYSDKIPEHLKDVQVILGCGDLPLEYLEFLVSMMNVPLLYVPGNHDPVFDDKNPSSRAEGCDFLDLKVMQVKGINVAGLGGSIRYQPHRPNQFTQVQMFFRTIRLVPIIARHILKTTRPLDIIIAHSPPFGINDDTDPAHIGFSVYSLIIKVFKPRYFLHGHVTVYKGNLDKPETQIGQTTVINVSPYKVINI